MKGEQMSTMYAVIVSDTRSGYITNPVVDCHTFPSEHDAEYYLWKRTREEFNSMASDVSVHFGCNEYDSVQFEEMLNFDKPEEMPHIVYFDDPCDSGAVSIVIKECK